MFNEVFISSLRVLRTIFVCLLTAVSSLATVLMLALGWYGWMGLSLAVFLSLLAYCHFGLRKNKKSGFDEFDAAIFFIVGLFVLSVIALIITLVLGLYLQAILSFALVFVSIMLFSFWRIQAKKEKEAQKAPARRDLAEIPCPACYQRVRVPARKGRMRITCPKCSTKFMTTT